MQTRSAQRPTATGESLAQRLLPAFRRVRARTLALSAPLSDEDCLAQSMTDASPVKWHLAHTSWFFETFVLAPSVPGYAPFHPAYGYLYNSYYNAVGERVARERRGLMTRPSRGEVLAFRAHVDGRVEELLARDALPPAQLAALEIGLNHEQQHQELLLTDLKHLLAQNPLLPEYLPAVARPGERAAPLEFLPYAGGVVELGHAGEGFAFDNEGPRHRAFLEPFELASRPVTCGELLAFVEDGGYRRAELWLSDGWDAVQREGWQAPMHWLRRDGAWWTFTLRGARPLDPEEPVAHVSYYEADACARFLGARLPTEQEWEHAAAQLPEGARAQGTFADDDHLHPRPVAARPGAEGPLALFGEVWEWTSSAYAPYPGFRAAEGALGEYNGKFMCNQLVLRGGSCASPRDHLRATYRNFFHAPARWQFSGLRLARSAR